VVFLRISSKAHAQGGPPRPGANRSRDDRGNVLFTISAGWNGPKGASVRSERMGIPAQTPQDCSTSSARAVADLPTAVFVERWRLITGEPPAILLNSRSAMLALLVASTPVAPLEPPVPAWDDSGRGGRTPR
jgi:hypothetical protein